MTAFSIGGVGDGEDALHTRRVPTCARALLILPTAGYRTEDFLAAASALDVEVVVATDRRQTIGDAIRIDLRRPERAADAIVELARDRPLDAVVAADDGGVVAAAIAATRLGLPSNPPEAASRARDKLALRRALAEAGVSQPRFAELPPGGDVTAVGFPAVLKPTGLAMGRGVIRADDAASAARIRAPDPRDRRLRRRRPGGAAPARGVRARASRSPSRRSCATAGWRRSRSSTSRIRSRGPTSRRRST